MQKVYIEPREFLDRIDDLVTLLEYAIRRINLFQNCITSNIKCNNDIMMPIVTKFQECTYQSKFFEEHSNSYIFASFLLNIHLK